MDLKEFLKSKNLSFSGRIEFNPQGITKYVANASESYGIKLDPQKVVFIVDDTVLGSGKDGCIVAVTGIAFKSMLQRPVYFPFDKVSGIEMVGRRIIVNGGVYTYDFSIVEESNVAQVFGCVQQWLNYRSDFEIDLGKYSEKLNFVKDLLKSQIIPLVMAAVEKRDLGQEEMAEAIDVCIDDVKELEGLISCGELNFSQAQYIDGLIELLGAMGEFMDSGDFDDELLNSNVYDRDFGKFLKGFLKPLIAQIKKELQKKSLMDKIKNF